MFQITRNANANTLMDIQALAKDYVAHSKAQNTVSAYRSDWRDFDAWCQSTGTQALPATPETLAQYITEQAARGKKTSTIHRRLVSISQAHQLAGYDSPTSSKAVRTVMAGIRRVHGTAANTKAAAVTEDIRAMVETLPDSIMGCRDRALLLLGFAGAFRRSELVALDLPDVAIYGEGIVITLRRSKTDQNGQGRKIGIPYGSRPLTCPVRALQAWLEASEISEGPLFRAVTRHAKVASGRLSDKAVALVVKRSAERAGLDPTRYAGHSLRAGLATAAAAAGVSERAIMTQTGHRSVGMVRRYIRDGSLFRENAAGMVGL